MRNPSHIVFLVLVSLVVLSPMGFAQTEEPAATTEETTPSSQSDTPWLDGVDLPTQPPLPNPIYPCEISMGDGKPIPAVLTEDQPITVQANSDIFGEKPPSTWKDANLTNAQWARAASFNWQFTDMIRNRSFQASITENLPMNQIVIVPPSPTKEGSLIAFINREFTFEEKPGSLVRVHASSSNGTAVKVTDITPPLCGLEISAGPSQKGTVWVVENPVNHFPLPKFGDVMMSGGIFTAKPEEIQKTLEHKELGEKMTLEAAEGVFLPKNGKITIKPVVKDNDQVDDASIQYGLCELKGDSLLPIGKPNPETIEPAQLQLPKQVFLFIQAKDVTGNKGSMFIPVIFQ